MKNRNAVGTLRGWFSVLFLGFVMFSLLAAQEARAVHRGVLGNADAPVGTEISNVARAEYTDSTGAIKNTESNPVVTTVAQVYDVNLEATAIKLVPIGVQVSFPHTVTNTGNGPDSYALTAVQVAGGVFTLTNIEIYADASCDGIPDNAVNMTATTTLSPGAPFCFIVTANVPATALNLQTVAMTITATSVNDTLAKDTNTDTVIVTTNAVVDVTKSLDIAQGPEGQTFTYTIAYSNRGNATATNVSITDMVPTGLDYVAASGRWSASGLTALGDTAAGVDQTVGAATMTYSAIAGVLPLNTLVTALISTVGPGASGFITFQVKVRTDITNAPSFILNGGAGPLGLGTTGIANETGEVAVGYDDGSGSAATPDQVTTTNVVSFNVILDSGVTGTGATVATTPQGSVFAFANTFTNTGSGPDTFNITLGTSTFPTGTTFAFLAGPSDGDNTDNMQLLDTNGDGIVDTGIVAANATVSVIVLVTLPTGATGGPFTVQKTAKSTADLTSPLSTTVTDTLTVIAAAQVDLTNNNPEPAAVAADGEGTDTVGTTTITTLSTNPGGSVTFELFVTNEGGAPDTYTLSSNTLFTFLGASVPAAPVGWSVNFFKAAVNVDGGLPACTTLVTNTAPVTETSLIPAGQFQQICAVVTVPASAIPTNSADIFFRATSPTSNPTNLLTSLALDRKKDRVNVNEVRAIALSANGGSTISPNGTRDYIHQLSNNGNITESLINITTSDSLSADGWTSNVYLDGDSNGDGIVDAPPDGNSANDTLIASGSSVLKQITVPAFGSVFLIVKVSAPLAASVPDVNVTTITATATLVSVAAIPPAVSNTDTTTVTSGSVTLVKTQTLDVNCDGTTIPDPAFSAIPITLLAKPDTCIRYQIVASNNGNLPVTGLTITDSVLTNTSYETSCGAAAVAASPTITPAPAITAPLDEATSGTILATIGTLSASGTATVTFCLQIN